MSGTFDAAQTEAIYPKGVERHWWSVARNRIIHRALMRTAQPGDRILEIGCGTGVVVDHLAGEGWDIRGCDLAPGRPATERAAGLVRLGVDAFELPEPERVEVRGVLLLDVLEHVEDPRAMLQGVLDVFPSLEWVFITLPARQELWSNYDEFNRHHRRYARHDAKQLAIEGLEAERCSYFFHSLWLPARLLCALGRDRSTDFHAPAGAAVALHAALASVFVLEDAVVPAAVTGSSLRLTLRVRR